MTTVKTPKILESCRYQCIIGMNRRGFDQRVFNHDVTGVKVGVTDHYITNTGISTC